MRLAFWLLALVGFLVAKSPTFTDPPYWDSNFNVLQARFIAEHSFDRQVYRAAISPLKPVLFTGTVAAVLRWTYGSMVAVHVLITLLVLILWPGIVALVGELAGPARAGPLAVLLCTVAPLTFAQAGLVQADLAVAAFATWAWVWLLRGRIGLYALFCAAAILCKESGYFLCVPSALYLWLRHRQIQPARRWHLGALLRALWPAAIPGLLLFGWLGFLQWVIGDAIPQANRDAFKPGYLLDALLHSLVEGGRLPIVILACAAVWGKHGQRTPARLATLSLALALPLLFPAPLPRYMLPSLPPLCALAALGLWQFAPRRRVMWATAITAALIVSWSAEPWHSEGGHHLDSDLIYRRLLKVQKDAAEALYAERPRLVLAGYPMVNALRNPPADHWLPAPVPHEVASGNETLAELCKFDFIVEASQSAPLTADFDRLRAAHALVPWRSFGGSGREVWIYRIFCP